MVENMHTPGPWTVGFGDGSGPEYIRVDESSKTVAKIRWGCSCCESQEPLTNREKANARLIATAPAGLALARSVVEWWENWKREYVLNSCGECVESVTDGEMSEYGETMPEMVTAARALIADAEGK